MHRPGVVVLPAPSPDGGGDQDAEDDDEANRRRQQITEAQRERYLQAYFDRLVFGGQQGDGFARRQFESALVKRIDLLRRTCGLRDAQCRKLHAAGQGDIKRFLDRVASERSRFREVNDPRSFAVAVQNAARPFVPERAALLAAEGPIFSKALPGTLSDAQRAALEKDARDRLVFRHRAAVRWTAVMLTRSLGLVDDQRRRLEAILLEWTRPPIKFDSNDYWLVMYQASRIPEARIRPIFDNLQWRVLMEEFESARRWGPRLKRGGLLPNEMFGDRPEGVLPALHLLEGRDTDVRH